MMEGSGQGKEGGSEAAVLVVRTPNQQVEDQRVECNLGWTVLQLKEHLADKYPTQPAISNQKLIYSGQLLHNNQHLRDILRLYNEGDSTVVAQHILHLVCAPPRDAPSSRPSPVPTAASTHSHSPPPPVRMPTPSQQAQPQQQQPVPTQEQLMQQHMLWMQQAYSQYMAGYWTYVQTGVLPQGSIGTGSQSGFFPTPPPTMLGQVPMAPRPDTIANQENPQPAERRAGAGQGMAGQGVAPAEVAPRMAAGGAAVADPGEEGPRDMLDWVYLLSRAFVLFSIVYFYSSFARFILVAGFGLLLYLYQVGFFRPPARTQPQVHAPVDGTEREADAGEDVGDGEEEELTREEEEDGEEVGERDGVEREGVAAGRRGGDTDAGDAPTDAVAVQPPMPPIQLVWTFFTSFFTSLIPEQQVL